MSDAILVFLRCLLSGCQSHRLLLLENLALRHQLTLGLQQSFEVAGFPPTASLLFAAYPGKTYSVLRRDSLDSRAWIPFADVPAAATATNRIVILRDSTPLAPGVSQRFYRLVTPRLPPRP